MPQVRTQPSLGRRSAMVTQLLQKKQTGISFRHVAERTHVTIVTDAMEQDFP